MRRKRREKDEKKTMLHRREVYCVATRMQYPAEHVTKKALIVEHHIRQWPAKRAHSRRELGRVEAMKSAMNA